MIFQLFGSEMKERSSCAKKLLDVVVNFVFVVAHGTIVFKT